MILLSLLACMSSPPSTVAPPPVDVEIGEIAPGGTLEVTVDGIPDGLSVELGIALRDGGTCDVRLAGSCSALRGAVLRRTATSAGGMATFQVPIPSTAPVGATVYLQVAGAVGGTRRITPVFERVVEEGCPDQLDWFQRTVQDPVLSSACTACHTSDGFAGFTRLVLTREGETPTWLEDNLAVLRTLATEVDPDGQPLLLSKPTNTHPYGHGGGVVLREDSDALDGMEAFVDWVTGDPGACQGADLEDACLDPEPGRRLLRRLTPRQYDRTVEDLLGVTSTHGSRFAADNVVHGFANQAEALVVSSLLADQFRLAAEDVAERAVAADLEGLLPCDASEGPDCAVEFITEFGRRAFRRPLEYDEIARYYGVWRDSRMGDGFGVGIQWTLTAMLQSPHFLYRSELGVRDADQRFQLTDYELATELSYTVLDTTPSDALLDLAEAGALSAPGGMQTALATLQAEPAAADQASAFVEAWLQLDRLDAVPRDADVYPDLTAEVRTWMAGETRRRVAALADGTLEELFTSPVSYLNDGLAAYYGLPMGTGAVDAEGFAEVDLSGSPYGGLLTQGSLMVTHALPAGSSPIHRGVMVRERLLCQELPPPPAALDTSPPEVDPSLSTRERYSQHSTDSACSGCHVLIDPVGFGLEAYGGDGRHRTSDGVHPLDTAGEIARSRDSNGSFDGALGLSQQLLSGSDLPRCYAKQWLTHATGTHVDAATCPSVALGSEGGQLSLSAPLDALVASPYFRSRVGEATELDAPGVELGPVFEADPGDAEPESPFEITITEASRWPTGVCTDVIVLNAGDEEAAWALELQIEGTIYNQWSSVASADSGLVVFTGESWNASLAPGATASFGWCANL